MAYQHLWTFRLARGQISEANRKWFSGLLLFGMAAITAAVIRDHTAFIVSQCLFAIWLKL